VNRQTLRGLQDSRGLRYIQLMSGQIIGLATLERWQAEAA